MAGYAHARRRSGWFQPPPPIVEFKAPRPAPSSALINAILEYADIRHELGGGQVILRLSPRRAKDRVLKAALGREARRLADVSVVWDEEESTLVRVLDDAAEPEPMAEADDFGELDTFELTEAALAYIERSQSRGR